MRNLDRIVEKVVLVEDSTPFLIKFLPYIGTQKDLSESSHVHIVFAELPRGIRFLHAFFMSEDDRFLKDDKDWQTGLKVGYRKDLANILKKGKPEIFDDLLMLTSFYLYSGSPSMDFLPVKPFVSSDSLTDQMIDRILSKSRGYCIWAYQTDRLMAIFERDSGARRDLLRDFRLLRPNATKWMATKKFQDGQSLLDAIHRRMWVRLPVAEPPVAFAFRLYNVFGRGVLKLYQYRRSDGVPCARGFSFV